MPGVGGGLGGTVTKKRRTIITRKAKVVSILVCVRLPHESLCGHANEIHSLLSSAFIYNM